jgi:hypothetical protein
MGISLLFKVLAVGYLLVLSTYYVSSSVFIALLENIVLYAILASCHLIYETELIPCGDG